MTRKEFVKMCGLLGIGLPVMSACGRLSDSSRLSGTDKVLIIGAGAAGLTAAHLLKQKGITVEVLEASGNHGGRMKRTTDFADFPIPTGAEWLHTEKSVLNDIVNDSQVKIDITTSPYDFEVDYALVEGKRVNLKEVGFTIDQKFIGATWFDFYERYVVPGIKEHIRYDTVVSAIDYNADQVSVTTASEILKADRVIITVPVKVLQQGAIEFSPALPEEKASAIKEVTVWGGCKAFIEFSECFYPTVTGFDTKPETAGHRLYYDAAYGQKTKKNIQGLFAVGSVANPYLSRKNQNQIDYILGELDDLFDGKASKHYVKHIFQNWTEEPFALGAYVHYFESWRTLRKLGKSVDSKLYFAGDAYTDGNDWSSVHAAAQSAIRAVKELVD